MGLAARSLRVWSQAPVIVLLLVTSIAAGCSADSTRLNDHLPRGEQVAPGVSITQPSSGPAPRGYWSWDGGTAITVARGETVFMIAHRHGVPASAIIQVNNLTAPVAIEPGQHLVIPRYRLSPISVSPAVSVSNAAALVPNPFPQTAAEQLRPEATRSILVLPVFGGGLKASTRSNS
jgi:hypothetical protein